MKRRDVEGKRVKLAFKTFHEVLTQKHEIPLKSALGFRIRICISQHADDDTNNCSGFE